MGDYTELATSQPFPDFNPATDATLLKEAMKGLGTDEDAIIKILANRTSIQRHEILQKYELAYSRDLIKDLKKELGGKFELAVMALMTPQPNYLARELNEALKGKKRNYNVIIEVTCARNNAALKLVAEAYNTQFNTSIEDDLKGDNSDVFERLLIAILSGNRDETAYGFSEEMSADLATHLHKAVEDEMGINEAEINRILSSYSYPLLSQVISQYKTIHGKSLADSFETQFQGDVSTAMRTVAFCLENRPGFLAKTFYDAMVGSGCKDKDLIRLIITRCEQDLGNVKQEYNAMYGTGPEDEDVLEKAIKADTKGDYEDLLMALLNPKPEE